MRPRPRRAARAADRPPLLKVAGHLLVSATLLLATATSAPADDTRSDRIQVEYVQPIDAAHQDLYKLLKNRGALEKLKEIFSPFRLPIDLNIRTVGCNGVSNAWYQKPAVSVCYEYLREIQQAMPKETTVQGLTPADAVLGQFFYVFAHEMGHAMFDILGLPVLGREEDAADNFATLLMLNFGDGQARPLIMGAAYSYKKYVQGTQLSAPLEAFSDAHSTPPQRYFNLLCLAYGSDPARYADFVEKDYLPKSRAGSCTREYGTAVFAFKELITPHLDKQLATKVLGEAWLPEAKRRKQPN